MEFDEKKCGRGFAHISFRDRYGAKCSISESSADDECIWIGIDSDANQLSVSPRVHPPTEKSGNLWEPLAEAHPEIETVVGTRMHLTRKQVADILPILQRFVEKGKIENVEKNDTCN